MFDDVCDVLRDLIHAAIKKDVFSEDSTLRDAMELEGITVQFTDVGLAIQVEDRTYSITIERES